MGWKKEEFNWLFRKDEPKRVRSLPAEYVEQQKKLREAIREQEERRDIDAYSKEVWE